jgi:DNA ligase (NAD+)
MWFQELAIRPPRLHWECWRILDSEVVHHSEMGIGSVSTESLSQILEKRRKASPYEMDGIIVSHDATHPRLREENPKHAFAFKSMAFMDKAEVVVTGVEWNVSKDGYFKPVVLFDGVDLAGVTVRRATGHNARYIVDQRIGPGARIVVVRSGDVIPYITEVLQGADASEERDLLPTGGAWNDTMVDVIVGSGRVTDGVLDEIAFKNIVYFFEKIGAVGVGAGVLKKIYSDGGSKTVGRMIALDKAHVSGIEGFQDRSAANFVDEIQKALAKADIVSLMCATNAFGRGIGTKTLTVVLKAFPSFGALRTQPPPMQALIQIGGDRREDRGRTVEWCGEMERVCEEQWHGGPRRIEDRGMVELE